MQKRLTLGKQERIKSRKAIEQLFRSGKSFSVFPYKVFYQWGQPASANPLLFGITAGTRNFKKAVDRNRIKRLTREAFRLQKEPLQQLLETQQKQLQVFFIYIGKELPDYESTQQKTALILNKLIQMVHENSAAHT